SGIEQTVSVLPPAADAPEAFAAVRVGDTVHLDIDGRSVAFRTAPPPDVDRAARAAAAHASGGGSALVAAPMPGAVLAIHGAVGEPVEAGAPVATLEAMKMEHVVAAPRGGRIASVDARIGQQVVRGQPLATIEG